MSDRPSRLRQARLNAGFKSARSAAVRFGWRPSTYTAHENGQNDYDGDAAVVYARAFRVEPEYLYMDVGTKDEVFNFVFPIVGYVGQNGNVILVNESAVEYASLHFKATDNHQAFRVVDDTLWPAYINKQLVMCIEMDITKHDDYILPQEAICRLTNGEIHIGTLLLSDVEGRYELLRFHSKPLLRIQIDRCWVVHARVEKLSWSLTGEGRASMIEIEDPRWREAIAKEYE